MQISDSGIGKRLGDMFLADWNNRSSIQTLKKTFSISSSEQSIFLNLFWLYYLAYTCAASSSPGKISAERFRSVADHLTARVIEKYRNMFGIKEDANNILASQGKTPERLYSCYNRNVNSPPSVHYHVGKEMCLIVNGDADFPSPGLILYFGEQLHRDTLRIKNYIDSL